MVPLSDESHYFRQILGPPARGAPWEPYLANAGAIVAICLSKYENQAASRAMSPSFDFVGDGARLAAGNLIGYSA
jgi:hypothetical protein